MVVNAAKRSFVTIWEGMDVEPVAFIPGRDKAALIQADFIAANGTAGTGVDLYIYENGAPTTTPFHTSLGMNPANGGPGGSAIIFDTLQVDGFWNVNSKGYNFRYAIRMADLASPFEGGKKYTAEFYMNTTPWGVIPAIWEITVEPTGAK